MTTIPIPPYIETARVEQGGFTCVTHTREAFDLRGTQHDQYGQCSAMIQYELIGPEGAISWKLFTGRYTNDPNTDPMAGGVYSHVPDPDGADCDLVRGGKCSGDVGYLIGDEVLAALDQSEDAMWDKLKEIYGDWVLGRD